MRAVRRVAVSLLVLAACVPEAEPPSARDGGVRDAGVAAYDGGGLDAGRDAGERDAGRDAGVRDAGFRDAGPVDAGPSFCAAEPADCLRANDCEPDLPAPTNCPTCPDYNRALCADRACDRPAVLDADDVHSIVVTIEPNVGVVQSFAGFAIADRTAGDRRVTCADAYAGAIDLESTCFNVLDSRTYPIPQTGDTFNVSFSRFTSGQRTLFLLYGHESTNGSGTRLGISCTEVDVAGPAGSGPYMVSGDNMRSL